MDKLLFDILHSLAFRNESLDIAIIFLAKYLPYIMIIMPLFLRDVRKIILSFTSAVLAKFVLVDLIGLFLFRDRPFVSGIDSLISHDPTASFPSSHTAFFFALSTAIFFYNKKLGSALLIGSLLIGLARVISGVHWPLDIIAGAAIGILSAIAINEYYSKKLSD